jgi:DNA-binding NtrC family response regulator
MATVDSISPLRKPVIITSGDFTTVAAVVETLKAHFDIEAAADLQQLLEKLKKKHYEFIFIDLGLISGNSKGPREWVEFKHKLDPFWEIYPSADIIVMSERDKIRDAVCAVKAGAADYVTLPIDPEELKFKTEFINEERRKNSELDYLRDQFWERDSLNVVRTHNPLMRRVFDKVRSVAPTRTTVMIYGETGTGKGVIARLIHRHSNRRGNQYISVHCGAIPDTLVESELFGHEKGAFTGAVRRKPGKFEIAGGGTIFLDEIGTISAVIQVKLLQVLQDRTFQRVGGEDILESDARVIAASNMDLQAMSEANTFRKDLFYRLNVFPISLPSLRERKEDIPILVDIFLKKLNQLYGKAIHGIHPLVKDAFQRYDWPGNIRELENLIERSYILENSSILTPESFPAEFFAAGVPSSELSRLNFMQPLAEVRQRALALIEKQYLQEVLAFNRGRINNSARHAGISTRQLHKLLTKYDIDKKNFKN